MAATRTPAFVALLRGINVGGVRLAMADLRQMISAAGYENVQTYVQSGNAVFTGSGTAEQARTTIEQALEEHMHRKIPVLVRNADQLGQVLKEDPIPRAVDNPSKYFVTFVEGEVPMAVRSKVEALALPDDEHVVFGRHAIYCAMEGGASQSVLGKVDWAKELRPSVVTTRNWKTVTTLFEMVTVL